MYGGNTSDGGGDVVARVKANKAKAEQEHNAKLASIRAALDGDAATARAATEAAAARADQERKAAAAARQQADEQRERALALMSWQQAGGTVESFEQQWPALRQRQIVERVTNADRVRQQAVASFYRSIF